MADDFDPYYTWLGIPPDEQPATHYRLLGVRLFEPNLDVISNAADQRMAFLRTFQVGKRSALSQRLLNEMAAAKVSLLDSDRRRAYDEKLRVSQPKSAAAELTVAPQPAQALSTYSPPSPVLVPSRQAVARPLPVATKLSSTTPDPLAAADPFADVIRDVKSQPSLPTKPPTADGSGDLSDQVTALVRAAASRMQESPLATAAYGVLAVGVVMLLSVGLWVVFGRGQPTTVAGGPPAPATGSSTASPKPESLPSTTAPTATPNSEETPKAPKPESSASLPREAPKPSPRTSPAAVSPVETVTEQPVTPEPALPVTPTLIEDSPPSPSEPASARATAIYNVLSGKFPQPRLARLSPTATSVADFDPRGQIVRVWPTSPAKKTAEPLTLVMESKARSVRFSANERLIAVGTESSLEVWDLASRRSFRVALPGPGIDVVFCDNGRLVAVTSEGTKTVRLVEVGSRSVLHTFQSTVGEIRSLAAGQQWLAALGSNGQIAIYDVRQSIHHGNLVHQPELPLTAVHMRGKEIFAFDKRCLTGWSAQELTQLSEASYFRTTPAPDAFDVHSGHHTQQANGTLSLFKWANNESPLARIAAPGGKFDVVDIAAERMLTIGPDEQLLIWNLERVKEAQGTIIPAEAIAVWSGAKPAPMLASAEKPALPKPMPASSDTSLLESVDPTAALEALRGLGVIQLPNTPERVIYLNLHGSKVTDADAKYIAAFPKLQNLYAERMPLSGKSLRYFSKLAELKTLLLSGTRIADDDLKFIAKLPNLESFMCGDTVITAAGVAHLKDLPKLRQLYLPQNINRDVIPALASMKQLQRFSPTPAKMDDADLSQLTQLTHLQSIDLQGAKLSLGGYQQLLKFREMNDILLPYNCPPEAIANLKNMPLHGFSCPTSARDEDIVVLNMPSLRFLQLSPEMSDKAVATASKLDNLETLILSNCNYISDGGLLPLKRLRNLKEISLPHGIGNAGLRIIAEIPSLERVSIPLEGGVGDDGVESLLELPKLKSLILPSATTDRSFSGAAKMKNLEMINIGSRHMTAKGLRELAKLERLQHLGMIVPLTTDLVDALKTLKQVKYMSLQNTGLTDEQSTALRQALPQTHIDIGR